MVIPRFLLAIDIGTTGVKSCLYELNKGITLVSSALENYPLYILDNGGVEQNPDEWWSAISKTITTILSQTNVSPLAIKGISFCSQLQGVVLVDNQGNHLRPAMSYMDQRAHEEFKEGISHGLKVSNLNLYKLIQSLRITKAVSASVKDPIWKYKWVEKHEPQIFKKIYKWLDVKEYIIAKCTGEFIATEGTAFATLLYDTRKEKKKWSPTLCKLFGVNTNHLPKIVTSTDVVGTLKENIAQQLGLSPQTLIFGGGGDAELIGVGAGAVQPFDTHIYWGTSGWVSTVVPTQKIDLHKMMASIVGIIPPYFHYFAEMETAGKCLEWVKNHLALDEIGIYLNKIDITNSTEKIYTSLYEYLSEVIQEVPSGSNGILFTPWLHGNRCPFEDRFARGMFFNIGLDTGKNTLIRAVVEGICFHYRWMLEAQSKSVKTSVPIYFVGGGALSPVICQILADILQRDILVPENPQNAGTLGAAIVAAVALKEFPTIQTAASTISFSHVFHPQEKNKRIYDKQFNVFKRLYKQNKQNFKTLNELTI